MLVGYIAAFILAGIATWWGTRWFLAKARQWTLMDLPNERSSHKIPTPRGGGLFFFPVISLFSLLAWLWQPMDLPIPWLLYSLFCGGALSFLGFRDDVSSLPSSLRLGAQIGLIIPLVLLGPDWSSLNLPLLPEIHWGWTGKLLLGLWFVGMINVYNFMDGIDGIAALQGVAVSIGTLFIACFYQFHFLSLVAVITLGTLTAFLWFNWQPARIFMGDVGSNFLGFLFAWFPTALVWLPVSQPQTSLIFAGFCLFLAPFILDGGFTFIRRLLNHENVLAAHRSHLYQRLVCSGLSHGKVSLLYFLWALVCIPCTILAVRSGYPQQPAEILYLSLVIALLFGGLIFLTTRKRGV